MVNGYLSSLIGHDIVIERSLSHRHQCVLQVGDDRKAIGSPTDSSFLRSAAEFRGFSMFCRGWIKTGIQVINYKNEISISMDLDEPSV